MNASAHIPKVILAGAGPGDVGLITIKAVEYLKKASFILADRLVSPEILKRYASTQAEIIYVGKHGGRESVRQEEINKLLIEYGNKDGLTVRLKGGDVAIFSNVIAEIDVLNTHNIPFEIVPGITSASGASASIQVPLTARELSKGVRFLTYYNDEHFTDGDWQNMAETTDTLVFYMSSKSLPDLIEKLKKLSKQDKALAIIEQTTTPQERVLTSTIFLFEEELRTTTINQPAIVIIGEVVRLFPGQSEIAMQTTSFFKEH